MPKKQVKEINPLEVLGQRLRRQASRPDIRGYNPHEKQLVFHTSPSKGRQFLGGNRSGKTEGGVAEDIFWATGKHPYLITPEPPIFGRVIAVDFNQGVEKILMPKFAQRLPLSELQGGSWEQSYSKELRTLTLENGSTIEFMSYEQELEKFAGTSRHYVHFDEEPPQDIFTENKARLIDVGGHWWMTMTPVEGMTWVYDEIYLPGKESPENGITVVEVDMYDNPHLQEGEIQEFALGLSDDDKEARIHGKFVQIGGLIYKHFDPEKHVIDPIDPKMVINCEQVATLDHGLNNPTAWLWAAITKDGRVIVFDEHYEAQKLVDYHAKMVHTKNQSHGKVPELYVGDPSIRNRSPISGTSVHEEYASLGIPIVLGNNDVTAGLGRVSRYLQPAADGRPNLLITRNCVNLIRELQRLRWATYTKKIAQRRNLQELQHKQNDHAADALRYLIMMRPDLKPMQNSGSFNSNPFNFPHGIDPMKAKLDESLKQEQRRPYQDWITETSYDEIMGGIW